MAAVSERKQSLGQKISAGAIMDDAAGDDFIVDGQRPEFVLRPQTVDEVSGALTWAHENHLAVIPWGGATQMHRGFPPQRYDVALRLDLLNKIVDFPAADMTVTVQAGLCLSCLQDTLGNEGQYLPIDPPSPERATLGGLIAVNASGPRRLAEGTLRDQVLGLKVVQANGSVVNAGSRVVKNVAGYDLCKLYTGSFGTLGVIVEATLKVRPAHEVAATLWCEVETHNDGEAVLASILDSELRPVFVEYLNGPAAAMVGPDGLDGFGEGRPAILVGLDSKAEAADWQASQLTAILGPHLTQFSLELDEERQSNVRFRLFHFTVMRSAFLVCKVNLLSSHVTHFIDHAERAAAESGLEIQALAHAGNGIVYVRVRTDAPPEAQVRALRRWTELAVEARGSLVVEKAPPEVKSRVNVWGPLRQDFKLMKGIKESLDPHRVLNPGRFIGKL